MMYEFLTEFMGFTLNETQVFFFGAVFLIIILLLIFSLFVGVIKLFR